MNDSSDKRQQKLLRWLIDIYNKQNITLTPVSGDASFRRYFRFHCDGTSLIAVDAPPALENSRPFVTVTEMLLQHQVTVPKIFHTSIEHGFFVLQDFGDRLLLDTLDKNNADTLYEVALQSLVTIQNISPQSLPPYDSELLQREMNLFSDWYLSKHLGLTIDRKTQTILASTYKLLEDNALQQPQVFVHRDYHSRNLMVLESNSLGIIDFQDAVRGPVTYDLVSLLRDCYINWPLEKIDQWVAQFYSYLPEDREYDLQQFRRWFDLMGVQRHLKATGIFCRLNYRDGKPAYLNDIPRTLNYVIQVSAGYDELQPFHSFLQHLK